MEQQKPQFATILACRGNDARPSDLEFELRMHCQKLRVVEKLSGAHLLLPESSVAVRAYYFCDLPSLQQQASKDGGDLDGLQAFLQSFRLAVVLFVLPVEAQRAQLDNSQSIFHRAQRIVNQPSQTSTDKTARILLVPDTATAISALQLLAADTTKEKRELKELYFDKQSYKHFLPMNGFIPASNSTAAAQHTAEAIRTWADRLDLPDGESDVLMSLLGTLGDIVTADDEVLSNVPIEERSKRVLHVFFGSRGNSTAAMNPPATGSLPPQPTRRMHAAPHAMEMGGAASVASASYRHYHYPGGASVASAAYSTGHPSNHHHFNMGRTATGPPPLGATSRGPWMSQHSPPPLPNHGYGMPPPSGHHDSPLVVPQTVVTNTNPYNGSSGYPGPAAPSGYDYPPQNRGGYQHPRPPPFASRASSGGVFPPRGGRQYM